ncbi:PaaI family thioesterase [Nocardia sp. NPDC003482]
MTDAAALGELVMAGFKKLGFIRFAGIEGAGYGPGRSVVTMAPTSEHLNHNGDLHAAMLFGLAETAAMGAAVSGIVDLMGETFIVARDGRIDYLARAKGSAGPFAATSDLGAAQVDRMRAEIRARTPIELLVPVDITDGDGKRVAAAEFTAVIRPRR